MICRSIFYKNMIICSDFSHPCYSHSSIFFFFQYYTARHSHFMKGVPKRIPAVKKIELFSRCFTRSVIFTWWSYNMKEQLVKISDPGNNPKKVLFFLTRHQGNRVTCDFGGISPSNVQYFFAMRYVKQINHLLMWPICLCTWKNVFRRFFTSLGCY